MHSSKKKEAPAGTFTVTAADYPALVKPVEISVSTVEDDSAGFTWIGWLGENKPLGIRCVVSSRFPLSRSWRWNVRKLKKDVIEDIDYVVDSHLVQKDDNVTNEFREIIERWKEYADPAKRTGDDHYHEGILVAGNSKSADCPACGKKMHRGTHTMYNPCDVDDCFQSTKYPHHHWCCYHCYNDYIENEKHEITVIDWNAVDCGKDPAEVTRVMIMDYVED